MYMHKYIHTHVYIYTHTHTFIYIGHRGNSVAVVIQLQYPHSCCTSVFVCSCTGERLRTCIYRSYIKYSKIYIHIHISVCVCIHMYIHMCIYIYVYMYIHIHICRTQRKSHGCCHLGSVYPLSLYMCVCVFV